MPRALERRLLATARRRHYGKRRTAAYVFGTLRRVIGWRPRPRGGGRRKRR